MPEPQDSLKWSAQYHVVPSYRTPKLQGDKITLPQSALGALLAAAPVVPITKDSSRPYTPTFDPFNPHTFAAEREARQLVDRQQQLPHPLTFRLVNPRNGRVAYAGIREFSADEDEIGLSGALQDALGLEDGSSAETRGQTPSGDTEMVERDGGTPQAITVHAKQLPKGTYVRLRPLEAGYDPEDWKSLLERYLRDNFTTLTNGEVLTIPSGRREKFRFLVDKLEPDGEGICIVDTDLEVDIEALNEEQARETLNRKLAKARHAPDTGEGSSAGGALAIGKEKVGQVLPGEYVDYEVKWQSGGGQGINFDLDIGLDDGELDLFISPFSPRQRAKAREDEHVFGDFGSQPSKRIRVSATNVALDGAEAIYVSVHAYRESAEADTSSRPIPFVLRTTPAIEPVNPDFDIQNVSPPDEEAMCKNCHQSIPKRTLPLHEAFCYRNNISCPHCDQVFLKNSPAWKSHWHCPHDSAHGNTPSSRTKHDTIFHPSTPYPCPNCDFLASSLPSLAGHRTSICPGKEILCQFCHLVVAQQGPDDPSFTDPEVLMSGLAPHELADGARTTECHLCNKIVRLRDMKTHLRIHDRDRLSQPRPRLCSNMMCGRTVKAAEGGRNVVQQLGLCDECFGPLYVTSYDPEGKALRRRVERRLLQQLMAGCGKGWCRNEGFCRTGRKNVTGEEADRTPTAREALPLVKPVVDGLADDGAAGPPLCFCVDEASQTRRTAAQSLAQDGEYELQWCVRALELLPAAAPLLSARDWLATRAPRIGELPC